jgi:hypothetical protein
MGYGAASAATVDGRAACGTLLRFIHLFSERPVFPLETVFRHERFVPRRAPVYWRCEQGNRWLPPRKCAAPVLFPSLAFFCPAGLLNCAHQSFPHLCSGSASTVHPCTATCFMGTACRRFLLPCSPTRPTPTTTRCELSESVTWPRASYSLTTTKTARQTSSKRHSRQARRGRWRSSKATRRRRRKCRSSKMWGHRAERAATRSLAASRHTCSCSLRRVRPHTFPARKMYDLKKHCAWPGKCMCTAVSTEAPRHRLGKHSVRAPSRGKSLAAYIPGPVQASSHSPQASTCFQRQSSSP